MTASPPESRRPGILWGIAIGVIALMLFLAFLRRGSAPPKPADANVAAKATADAELQRQLRATLDGLRPERLNVSSNPPAMVGDLNLWWVDYSKTADVANAEKFAATMKDWLGEEAAAAVAANRFDLRDAGHIRDALLYRSIAASLAVGGQTERQRVEAAFDRVVRQISLLPGFVSSVPLGSFEVLLAGRGTADDRIWAFAEILRQLGIECVVLEPESPPADAAIPPKLVGAIVKGEGVLLFDPQLGLPIPPADDVKGALPTRTVTLSEVKQNDALLRQFDVPGGPAYPWTAESLGTAKVKFIINSAWGSPRMLALQVALPAEFAATLFDGPPPTADAPSLQDRIVAAGKDGLWSADAVSAWKYPEHQLSAFVAAGGEESPEVKRVLATQYGPRVILKKLIDGVETDVEEDSKQPLRVVRIQHLAGDVPAALTAYGYIRSQPLQVLLDGQLQTLDNSAVRSDAIHWIAVCQEELRRYDAAINTLTLLQRDDANGIWSSPTTYAIARCEALRGNLPRAIELLPSAEANQPTRLADAWLQRRWQALSAPPAAAANESK
jgi:hypothetical protein